MIAFGPAASANVSAKATIAASLANSDSRGVPPDGIPIAVSSAFLMRLRSSLCSLNRDFGPTISIIRPLPADPVPLSEPQTVKHRSSVDKHPNVDQTALPNFGNNHW